MVEELLHYFCCFECNGLFAKGSVKGCSKHVSSVVAAAKYCSLTPCQFQPFSKRPMVGINGPKFLETCFEVLETVSSRKYALTSRKDF